MTGRLKNKVAVITGAAAGIGRASALSFAKEGAKVFCVDWDGKGAAETAELVKKAGVALTMRQVCLCCCMCAMCCKIFLALAQAVLPPDNPDEQVSCGICFDGERAQRFARQTCLDFGCRFACLANLRYALHTSVRAARVAAG